MATLITPRAHAPAVALVVVASLAACGPRIHGGAPSDWDDVIVQDIDGAQVLDARTDDLWRRGHIPGASQLHWSEISRVDPETDLWGPLPSAEIAALLGARGVASDRPVVIYGSGPDGVGDDGDIYWTLRWLGHTDVRVLDGGWPGWLATGGEPDAGVAPSPAIFTPDVRPELLVDSDGIAAHPGPVIDVRSAEEYTDGHIPGALSYPWDSVFDGLYLRDPAALRADLADSIGVTAQDDVIVYCRRGVRAGHSFMVLEALGFESVASYAGSWQRWQAEGRPTSTGTRETHR